MRIGSQAGREASEMTKAKPKTGWAVVDHDGISIRTVSDTRRGALVNWLCDKGMLMLAHATDEQIENTWADRRQDTTICTTVEIKVSGLDIL